MGLAHGLGSARSLKLPWKVFRLEPYLRCHIFPNKINTLIFFTTKIITNFLTSVGKLKTCNIDGCPRKLSISRLIDTFR